MAWPTNSALTLKVAVEPSDSIEIQVVIYGLDMEMYHSLMHEFLGKLDFKDNRGPPPTPWFLQKLVFFA